MIQVSRLSTIEGRRAALEAFVVDWYGGRRAAPEKIPGCPEVLCWWAGLLSANPRLTGEQNRFCAPERHDPDPFLVYGDPPRRQDPPSPLWVFWSENQGVVTLFCESDGEDPGVWSRCDYPPGPAQSFVREREPLTGQLLRWTLMEALYGAPVGGVWASLDRAVFDEVMARSGLVELPLQPTGSPSDSLVFYAGQELIAASAPGEWPGEVSVILGARTDSAVGVVLDCLDDPSALGL